MLDGVLLLWFALTAGAVAFVVWDSATNTFILMIAAALATNLFAPISFTRA